MRNQPLPLCAGNCFRKALSQESPAAQPSTSAGFRIDGGLISGGSTPASTAEPADRVPWDAMGPPCMTHVRSAVTFSEPARGQLLFFSQPTACLLAHPPPWPSARPFSCSHRCTSLLREGLKYFLRAFKVFGELSYCIETSVLPLAFGSPASRLPTRKPFWVAAALPPAPSVCTLARIWAALSQSSAFASRRVPQQARVRVARDTRFFAMQVAPTVPSAAGSSSPRFAGWSPRLLQ